MKDRKLLKVYFKCSNCNNLIPFDVDMCEYCGSAISYDDKESEYYISSKICFKCGYENKVDSLYCKNCNSRFTIVCPKCKEEIETTEEYCKECGHRIDENYIENEVNRRLASRKKEQSSKVGLYFGGIFFFLLTLLFAFFTFHFHDWGIKSIGYGLGTAIFFVLFIVMAKSLITKKKGHHLIIQ